MNAILVKSALDHIEFSTIYAVFVVLACALLSYQVSTRRPLYYNLYVVEMHTWTSRRVVQVLHLGQEFFPPVPWDRLVQRMRARAPRVQGEQRIAISDTNIVIQSPHTVIDSPAPARTPDVDMITLWDIEMPPPSADHPPDAMRDSQYAAAAAIAILARGDDASLRSRVFHNSQNQSEDGSGNIPSVNRARTVNPPNDYVSTDVTYITPTITFDVHHQQIARLREVANSEEPRNVPPPPPEVERERRFTLYGAIPEEEEEEREEGEEEEEDDDDLDLASVSDASERLVNPVLEVGEDGEEVNTTTSNIEGPSEGKVLIRLKFMNDTEKDAYALLRDTVAKFRTEHFADTSNKVVRLIFQGQLLRDDQRTLEEYGVQAGSVVHCHISTTPYTRPPVVEPPSPIVDQSTVHRRRIAPNSEAPTVFAESPPDRRQVGNELTTANQLFLIITALLPILSGIRMRHFFRPSTVLAISHWLCSLLVDNGLLQQDRDRDSPFQPSMVLYIFVGQLFAVIFFYFYFPDILDRTGVSICIIVALYFVFVVYSRHRRRQPDNDQVINEERIVQETISLI